MNSFSSLNSPAACHLQACTRWSLQDVEKKSFPLINAWACKLDYGKSKYLCCPSHVVVRNDILGDVSDGAENVFHQVGREVNVALHYRWDLVDNRHPGRGDEFLQAEHKKVREQ